ncbi:hypothetical protein [Chryseobacterium sp. 3008163]|uniref:hypothetical protein n=1 Tax=Chryseobacterium sp. 3008163 TaxID=2478663 RepID=UPI001013D1FC|nr:hypothetical protein [Chryseobacterium sp. 3008163]
MKYEYQNNIRKLLLFSVKHFVTYHFDIDIIIIEETLIIMEIVSKNYFSDIIISVSLHISTVSLHPNQKPHFKIDLKINQLAKIYFCQTL